MDERNNFVKDGEETAVLQRYLAELRSEAPASNARDVPTILFIHGATSSSREWDGVVQHLQQDYRTLALDLPGHGRFADIVHLLSLDFTARLFASIVRECSRDGKAHIVGLSLGARIAMALVTAFPSVIDTVFISGYWISQPSRFSGMLPRAFWTMACVEHAVPLATKKWYMGGTDLVHWHGKTPSMELCRKIGNALRKDDLIPGPWPARTLVVAAGKSGVLPTSDSMEDAKKVVEIGSKGNKDIRAVTHPQMRHPWNQQNPLLFANALRAWIEQGEIIEGFVAIP